MKSQNRRLAGVLISLLFSFTAFASIHLTDLRTEYTVQPLGLDVKNPRFSWRMVSDEAFAGQDAFQIVVKNEKGATVWNSGKIRSMSALNQVYAGAALQPVTRYNWHLTVWDQNHRPSFASDWFETGLMTEDWQSKAWGGASWIGGREEERVLYPDFLPVFRLSVQLLIPEGSNRAALRYGMDDPRLMAAHLNISGLKNQPGSSYVEAELSLGNPESGTPATLSLYRSGYTSADRADTSLVRFPIAQTWINKGNQHAAHTLYISSVLGETRFYIDGQSADHQVGTYNLNPLGRGGDFVAYPVLGKIGYALQAGQSANFSNLTVQNYRSPASVLYRSEKSWFGKAESAQPLVHSFSPQRHAMPMLRSVFKTRNVPVRAARLYVTARGVYEFYVNGQRIGNAYFAPGASQYDKTQFYQTYDITPVLRKGANAVGALLGEGWWSGGATYMGAYWNFFGDRQSLLAKLVITYADGQKQELVTNPAHWKYYNNGPVVYSGFFQGERQDALRQDAVKGWATVCYNDSGWARASTISLEKETARTDTFQSEQPLPGDFSRMKLKGQYDGPVQVVDTLKAVAVEEVRPGVFVYDLGQNQAGIPSVLLNNLQPGQELTLRFAEVKYPDLPGYEASKGMIMLENIRAAMAQMRYRTRGGREIVQPHFTYFGYRYLEISGLSSALPLNSVRSLVLSSLSETKTSFQCSNEQVNKLWENINWSARSNFLSIPTDCPQRNERLGWSGDISVFSKTAAYLGIQPGFLRKHMQAMRDVQSENGRFPDVAPLGVGFGETMWGSAGITVPWQSYLQYGDVNILAEHYDAMNRYIRYLLKDIDPVSGVFKEKEQHVWGSLGDWLSLEDSRNEKLLFWEAYLIYDLQIMNRVAALLGHPADAERFANLVEERKAFFNKTYLNPLTGKTVYREKVIDTQTSYVLPLAFHLVSDSNRLKVENNLVETILRSNRTDQGRLCPPYSLMTGFIGTAWISTVLSEMGRTDLAYRILQQKEYPSWLYPVTQGATTIWERLNSYTHEDGFGGNNNMNSFNHYSFGAVGAWICERVLGISRDEQAPGFKYFILQPEPDPTDQMTFAKGSYSSLYGRIESAWNKQENGVQYRFVVPANTVATLVLNAESPEQIRLKNESFEKIPGVQFLRQEKGKVYYTLLPGTYEPFVRK